MKSDSVKLPALRDAGKSARAVVARTLALLPGSSTHFGPPRREATSASVSDPAALIRHQIVPARTTLHSAAELADPPLDQWMAEPRSAVLKEIYLAELPQGRYWGRYHGYIVDRNDTLLSDLSPTFSPSGHRHDGLEQIKLPPVRELQGTVAVINTIFATNFHHWLLDTVPRFEWVRRAGWDLSKIDYFILPKKLLRHHLTILERLGIAESKWICTNAETHIRADTLLVPCRSEPGDLPLENDYTPEGLQFVRKLLLEDNPFLEKKHPRLMLVSREKARARRLVQAERANQLLFAQGFEKVLLEDHTLQKQAAFFHHADCVVMPTGGNLANLAFCRPGTIVIELFSPNYYPPFTVSMMDTLGLCYYAVVAERVSRPNPDARLGNEDIDVDPDRLSEIVRLALAKHPRRPAFDSEV